ncbi:PadR family transcriptional regulator [Streptosporangium sp. NBC_01755]|uniref:PadR family transcriptional regulator n=1 Tax=unclassified Streptosporangium TaxID=2632669 RepID=UPI002DD81D66|nr:MULTISPECIES: helix-turn-helix transcriptional regulator [unclassified Streptosporangium]WSA25654.1 PadR family transcriptional regulator [Streptosporangium sp. NBC_01810]WSD02956.1 PadR family transcriptional regulator [Streptosporangium sp. NBC_01755]
MALREQSYLILLALSQGPLHGYGVIKTVRELSEDRVRLGAGTLYGALDRLAGDGLVIVVKEEVVDGRHRRYYDLTGHGQQVLTEETVRLSRLAATAQRRLNLQPGMGT